MDGARSVMKRVENRDCTHGQSVRRPRRRPVKASRASPPPVARYGDGATRLAARHGVHRRRRGAGPGGGRRRSARASIRAGVRDAFEAGPVGGPRGGPVLVLRPRLARHGRGARGRRAETRGVVALLLRRGEFRRREPLQLAPHPEPRRVHRDDVPRDDVHAGQLPLVADVHGQRAALPRVRDRVHGRLFAGPPLPAPGVGALPRGPRAGGARGAPEARVVRAALLVAAEREGEALRERLAQLGRRRRGPAALRQPADARRQVDALPRRAAHAALLQDHVVLHGDAGVGRDPKKRRAAARAAALLPRGERPRLRLHPLPPRALRAPGGLHLRGALGGHLFRARRHDDGRLRRHGPRDRVGARGDDRRAPRRRALPVHAPGHHRHRVRQRVAAPVRGRRPRARGVRPHPDLDRRGEGARGLRRAPGAHARDPEQQPRPRREHLGRRVAERVAEGAAGEGEGGEAGAPAHQAPLLRRAGRRAARPVAQGPARARRHDERRPPPPRRRLLPLQRPALRRRGPRGAPRGPRGGP